MTNVHDHIMSDTYSVEKRTLGHPEASTLGQ